MSTNQHRLIERIRDRLGGTQAPELPPVLRTPARSQGADTFCAALESVSGQVHRVTCSDDGLLVLRGLIADREWTSIACSDSEFLQGWCERLGSICRPDSAANPIPREKLLKMDAGLCTAQIGIADTGSLALCSEAERHRLVSLVPPSSIIVLFERDLVPDFAAALQRFEENGLPTTLSFITGPSRTADIELTLTVGVHGPASVDVILIREADGASA